MTDIAFIGRMRSGKDSAGARLVEHHGYTRLAFADPLKEMALALDPMLDMHTGQVPLRLSRVVELEGWERAKTVYPEVRRTLQQLGEAVRALDSDFWLDQLVKRWQHVPEGQTVVTDVRYRNEADALKYYGFKLVRIVRPAVGDCPTPETHNWGCACETGEGIRTHRSETELADYTVDSMIYNGGSLAELYQGVDALAQ